MRVSRRTTSNYSRSRSLSDARSSEWAHEPAEALVRSEQERNPDFLRLANALSALYPKENEEKRLLDAPSLVVPRQAKETHDCEQIVEKPNNLLQPIDESLKRSPTLTDKEIAELAAVTLDDIDCLRRGSATSDVSNRLGVTIDDLDQFLKGKATEGMRRCCESADIMGDRRIGPEVVTVILPAITPK